MIIYFYHGAYGTFIEWCLNYFTNPDFNHGLPFLINGSSHAFVGNGIISHKQFKELISSNKLHKFQRIHPKVISDDIDEELSILSQYTDKIIFLYYDTDNAFWGFDNQLTKNIKSDYSDDYKSFRRLLIKEEVPDNVLSWVDALDTNYDHEHVAILYEKYFDNNNIKRWGKDNIRDLERWELREFFSFYFYEVIKEKCSKSKFENLKLKFPRIKFIEISSLVYNFNKTIREAIAYSGYEIIRETELDNIFNAWLPLQIHRDKDSLIKSIVTATLDNVYLEWKSLTIFDEAEIQRLIRTQGKEFKCFGLNEFPNNSKDLNNYVE